MKKISFEKIEMALAVTLSKVQKEIITEPYRSFCKRSPSIAEFRSREVETAAILRLILSEGDSCIDLDLIGRELTDGTGTDPADIDLVRACAWLHSQALSDRKRYQGFCLETIRLGQKLFNAGVEVRDICYKGRYVRTILSDDDKTVPARIKPDTWTDIKLLCEMTDQRASNFINDVLERSLYPYRDPELKKIVRNKGKYISNLLEYEVNKDVGPVWTDCYILRERKMYNEDYICVIAGGVFMTVPKRAVREV